MVFLFLSLPLAFLIILSPTFPFFPSLLNFYQNIMKDWMTFQEVKQELGKGGKLLIFPFEYFQCSEDLFSTKCTRLLPFNSFPYLFGIQIMKILSLYFFPLPFSLFLSIPTQGKNNNTHIRIKVEVFPQGNQCVFLLQFPLLKPCSKFYLL